jgi:hypothetical protein
MVRLEEEQVIEEAKAIITNEEENVKERKCKENVKERIEEVKVKSYPS